ncbi:hypothetical protein N6Y36_03935 [Morganella morganii]|nr:hypothetical protein N6Y36_03935 [Morganella morganii]
MKELSHAEIELVSGAGCVQDTITDLGKKLGDWGFELLGPYLTADLPVFGKVSLKDAYPGWAGKSAGKWVRLSAVLLKIN